MINTGSAASIVYQQGAKYANGEFIQIHPTAIPGEINSPFAYLAPCWYTIDAADPVLIIEFVVLPKIIPGPPEG
jgi:succinate dehydrogenase/fumarate reductase flavoprotein subunit